MSRNAAGDSATGSQPCDRQGRDALAGEDRPWALGRAPRRSAPRRLVARAASEDGAELPPHLRESPWHEFDRLVAAIRTATD